MRARWSTWLYALLMTALQAPLVLKLWWRGRREPLYRQHLAQRFGFYRRLPERGEAWIWLHAVSLGETRAAAALVQALRQIQPGLRLLLTHSTATGWAAGEALLTTGDCQVWAPWDAPGPVRRFFRDFQPRVGLIMETEVWPGWLRQAQAEGVPMVLLNARLSARSATQAERWGSLMRPAYTGFTLALAQSDDDAQRLRALGVGGVRVVGNLKYDMALDSALIARGQAWRQGVSRPVVMLASSREGEEMLWAEAVARVSWADQVQWLIVPRHPQRWDAVAALLSDHGWSVSRRSTWLGEEFPVTDVPRVLFLGDSMGEMAAYYSCADVALLGGSFAPLGGQNLIEALACACPVVTGPHMHNFAQALTDLTGDAVVTVADMDQALAQVAAWLADLPELARRGATGQSLVQAHAGAVARTLDVLREHGWVTGVGHD